jgi:adenylosuccinate synthase
MGNIVIIGIQHGDEGKGRVAHELSKDYDWCIRYSGGSGAGHTIYRNGKKYVHRLVPCIDFNNSKAKGFLGADMVVNLPDLIEELSILEKDFPGISKKIYVDPDAFLVLPEHIEEDKAKNGHLGSTSKGIGPAYVAKMGRVGFRIKDILKGKLSNQDSYIHILQEMGINFLHVLDLEKEFRDSKLLFEGAQSISLDLNLGQYPYVSCGDSGLAGIHSSGFSFIKIDEVYGISKAYNTKVGTGPFPSEIDGKEAETIRIGGKEFGSVTGRSRRIGWLDIPSLNYSIKKGGITKLIITKFDILNGMKEIPVCTSYEKNPVCSDDFFTAKPHYANVVGWENAKDLNQLKPFIDLVESRTGIEVAYVSCGVNPEDMMKWK